MKKVYIFIMLLFMSSVVFAYNPLHKINADYYEWKKEKEREISDLKDELIVEQEDEFEIQGISVTATPYPLITFNYNIFEIIIEEEDSTISITEDLVKKLRKKELIEFCRVVYDVGVNQYKYTESHEKIEELAVKLKDIFKRVLR